MRASLSQGWALIINYKSLFHYLEIDWQDIDLCVLCTHTCGHMAAADPKSSNPERPLLIHVPSVMWSTKIKKKQQFYSSTNGFLEELSQNCDLEIFCQRYYVQHRLNPSYNNNYIPRRESVNGVWEKKITSYFNCAVEAGRTGTRELSLLQRAGSFCNTFVKLIRFTLPACSVGDGRL